MVSGTLQHWFHYFIHWNDEHPRACISVFYMRASVKVMSSDEKIELQETDRQLNTRHIDYLARFVFVSFSLDTNWKTYSISSTYHSESCALFEYSLMVYLLSHETKMCPQAYTSDTSRLQNKCLTFMFKTSSLDAN